MTDLLLETGLSDEQEEYDSAARECAEALFYLLNATLEYSSLKSGCIQLESSEFQPGELVDGLAEEAGSRARARGMEMRVRKGAGMDWTIVGDAHRIRQVIALVLTSVIRYGSGDWFESTRNRGSRGRTCVCREVNSEALPYKRSAMIGATWRLQWLRDC